MGSDDLPGTPTATAVALVPVARGATGFAEFTGATDEAGAAVTGVLVGAGGVPMGD